MPDPTIPSLLQMSDPYGGRTMAQVVQGGVPYAAGTDYDAAGNDQFSQLAAQWSNQPATNDLVSRAIAQGAQYQPDFARSNQSSGAEGGWFSIPGTQPESNVPWGMNAPNAGENPAPGLMGLSTNNWRQLPEQYRSPQWAMRAGHIINRANNMTNPNVYAASRGHEGGPFGLGGPGHGYPVSIGSPVQRGYFFPGQIEPWTYEGGPGTT